MELVSLSLSNQGTLNVSKHRAQNEAFLLSQGLSNKSPGTWTHQLSLLFLSLSWFNPCLSSDLGERVLLFGAKSRNRAVHGDLVAVELLPRDKWRGKVTALTEGQGDEKTGEDGENKPMPTGGSGPSLPCVCLVCVTEIWTVTGQVVGILQRNWRDYVVTFPPRDRTQSQSRNSQRILAIPWDQRIPKIRVSTQQAEALQVRLRFLVSL